MSEKNQLVSMKRDARERHSFALPVGEGENYGYGLCIRLEKYELEKLKLAVPRVGKEFTLTAIVKVTAVHESESEQGEDCGVTLQITDMNLR